MRHPHIIPHVLEHTNSESMEYFTSYGKLIVIFWLKKRRKFRVK